MYNFNSRQFTSKERVSDTVLDHCGASSIEENVKHILPTSVGRLVCETLPLTITKYGDVTEYSIRGYFLTREDVEKILRLLDEALIDKNLSIIDCP